MDEGRLRVGEEYTLDLFHANPDGDISVACPFYSILYTPVHSRYAIHRNRLRGNAATLHMRRALTLLLDGADIALAVGY